MTKVHHRIRVILGFSTVKVAVLIAGARNIYAKMFADATQFPSPNPTMAALLGLINALETAEPPVRSRTLGASTLRDAAAHALVTRLQQEVAYVQTVADASPDTATAIVAAAGMKIAATPVRVSLPLTLTNSKPSGTVLLRANVALLTEGTTKAVAYAWSYSTDGEKTWLTLPMTAIGKTTITGLAPMTTVAARVAIVVRNLPVGDWSPVSTLVVQ